MSNLDFVIDRIQHRMIEPPKNLTAKELQDYLNGYAQCQKDIISLIKDLAQPQY